MKHLDHNPRLAPWNTPTPNKVAGKGDIETPGKVPNIVWQTRSSPPTAYENALGDALESAFEAGAATPDDVVRAFNRAGFLGADGQPWTEARFLAEMQRLGT